MLCISVKFDNIKVILLHFIANQKTSSEHIREQALLQELLETVSLRNSIVDSIEEDRIRYTGNTHTIIRLTLIKSFGLTLVFMKELI